METLFSRWYSSEEVWTWRHIDYNDDLSIQLDIHAHDEWRCPDPEAQQAHSLTARTRITEERRDGRHGYRVELRDRAA